MRFLHSTTRRAPHVGCVAPRFKRGRETRVVRGPCRACTFTRRGRAPTAAAGAVLGCSVLHGVYYAQQADCDRRHGLGSCRTDFTLAPGPGALVARSRASCVVALARGSQDPTFGAALFLERILQPARSSSG
eukprot:2872699-Prymnesium_polylepis.1